MPEMVSERQHNSCSRVLIARWLRPIRYSGYYISILYIVIKLLYALNCAFQFFLLNAFLQGDVYSIYGITVRGMHFNIAKSPFRCYAICSPVVNGVNLVIFHASRCAISKCAPLAISTDIQYNAHCSLICYNLKRAMVRVNDLL